MELSYNGVHMELLQLDRVERDAVYSDDGADLLYIRWLIGATCIYSPGGRPVGVSALVIPPDTASSLRGNGTTDPTTLRGAPPVEFPFQQEHNVRDGDLRLGFSALQTDAELRTKLWTPRRQLTIGAWTVGGFNFWLISPKPGFFADIAGGPKPIAVDVIRSEGEGTTFGVHFQIETAVSPCYGGADNFVLSHRWQMTHTHDEDNYLTRIIEGTVVFNVGFIAGNNLQPDWFRNQFFHAIPLGFKRTLGPITMSSDGSTLKYTLIDTDQTVVFDAGDSGATRMEIVENLQYMQPWRVIGGRLPNTFKMRT